MNTTQRRYEIYEKLKKYKENYLVDVIKDNEQEREID